MQEFKEKADELLLNARKYAELQKESIRLLTAEKLTLLISWVGCALICLIIFTLFAFFIGMGLSTWIGNLTTPLIGYCVTAIVFAALLVLFYLLRHHIVTEPIAKAMVKIFAPEPEKDEDETNENEA